MLSNQIFGLVKEMFNGDTEKTYKWFNTVNPLLGGITPLDMIRRGRKDKLISFIHSQLNGNFP